MAWERRELEEGYRGNFKSEKMRMRKVWVGRTWSYLIPCELSRELPVEEVVLARAETVVDQSQLGGGAGETERQVKGGAGETERQVKGGRRQRREPRACYHN